MNKPMSPKILSFCLRTISDKIDRSSRPSRTLVARELRRVLAAMETTTDAIPAALDASYFESNSADDVAHAFAPFFHSVSGPFYVAPGQNGYVFMSSDPSLLTNESPVRLLSNDAPVDSTFKRVKERCDGPFEKVSDASAWLTSPEVSVFASGDSGDSAEWLGALETYGLT